MDAQNNYVQTFDTNFHSNVAINVETTDKNPFTTPTKVWFSTFQF